MTAAATKQQPFFASKSAWIVVFKDGIVKNSGGE